MPKRLSPAAGGGEVGLVRRIKACRRTCARQYAREKASVVEKCVRAVSTRMERERPNARPALLDIPATGGAWAILGISYDALHARWQRARCEDADGTGTTER